MEKKSWKAKMAENVPAGCIGVGGVTVSVGISLLSGPAGIISLGVLFIALGVIAALGMED